MIDSREERGIPVQNDFGPSLDLNFDKLIVLFADYCIYAEIIDQRNIDIQPSRNFWPISQYSIRRLKPAECRNEIAIFRWPFFRLRERLNAWCIWYEHLGIVVGLRWWLASGSWLNHLFIGLYVSKMRLDVAAGPYVVAQISFARAQAAVGQPPAK